MERLIGKVTLGRLVYPVEGDSDCSGIQNSRVGTVAMWWTIAEMDIFCRLSWHRLGFQ